MDKDKDFYPYFIISLHNMLNIFNTFIAYLYLELDESKKTRKRN